MVGQVDDQRGDSKPTTKVLRIHRAILTLILFAFVAALLIFRFSLPFSYDDDFTLASDVDPVLLNSTLTHLAESDPSEEPLRRDIALLLEADLDKLSRTPPFRSIDLRSPSFHRLYHLHFLPLLSRWSSLRQSRSPPAEATLSSLLPLLSLPTKYPSCAVVGNSGILLNSNHGPLIDSHAAVIRLNNARISAFPSHVGTKTTLSFINSNVLHLCSRSRDCSSTCLPYGPAVPLLLYICQPLHFLDVARCNSSSFHVTHPALDLLCSKIVKYYSLRRWFSLSANRTLQGWFSAHDGLMFHYSSGMQAVIAAFGVCDRVSLFGFGKSPSAKHHYHTHQKAELDLHDYEAEYDLYRDLADNDRPHTIPFLSGIRLPPLHIYH